MPGPLPAPEDPHLAELLDAPDRDRVPGEPPVVSLHGDEAASFLAAVRARAAGELTLVRRGIEHGHWVELAPDGEGAPGPPLAALLGQRWHTARPIPLRGLVDPRRLASEIDTGLARYDALREPGGLRRVLKAARDELDPFELLPRDDALSDPERDLERVPLAWNPPDERRRRVRDLWAKSGWLSTHEHDASLRLRLSFGAEGRDDASRDLGRLRLVGELAGRVFPEARAVHDSGRLLPLLEEWVGDEVFFTQHIAYWNAPNGGALFHHDAFDEDALGGQRAVVYVQLAGATAWLALSIEDLTRRVIEFGEYLAEGELGWVRAALFRSPDEFARFEKRLARFTRVRGELARPGCGGLGRLVNRGPEFTALLADAGHAYVLRPGDALVLPNHGYACTAMHSVFCASDEPTYALSLAVREGHPLPPAPGAGESAARGRASTRRRRRRRPRA
jgi:hypothetical protein